MAKTIDFAPQGGATGKVCMQVPNLDAVDLDFNRDTVATLRPQSGVLDTSWGVDLPRYNFDEGETCPNFLVQPQSTNIALYSENFSNVFWNKRGTSSIISNTKTSPKGDLTADTLSNATDVLWNSNGLQVQISISSSTNYTLSLYVKSLGSTTFKTLIRNNNTGALVEVSHSINSETWTRVTQTITTTPTQTVLGVVFGGTNGDVAIWGAQFEELPYATSYLPTVATTATRLVESFSKTGLSSYFGQTQGVIYLESKALADDLTDRILEFGNSTNNDALLFRYSATSNRVIVQSDISGVKEAEIIFDLADSTANHKFAFRYEQNNFAFFVDGVKVGTDLTGSLPIAIETIESGNSFFAKIKQLSIYDTLLSDGECITLTTL